LVRITCCYQQEQPKSGGSVLSHASAVAQGNVVRAISAIVRVSASQLFEIPKSELVASKEQPSGRFSTPITNNELRVLQLSRFPKKTIDNGIWAVTLFGE
jgi:hypothetical protein